jgi:hypothetical protein
MAERFQIFVFAEIQKKPQKIQMADFSFGEK